MSLKTFEKIRAIKPDIHHHQSSVKSSFHGKSKNNLDANVKSCGICSGNHYMLHCPQYANKTVQQRIILIKKHQLCFNCLGLHKLNQCRTSKRCQKCAAKHHTSIHKASQGYAHKTSATAESAIISVAQPKTLHSSIEKPFNVPNVLLATAYVKIVAPNGESLKARALIDQGSEISLITERIAQRLKLRRSNSNIPLIGIGAQRSTKTKRSTTFTIAPHYDSNFQCIVSAHILPKLTTSIPSVAVNPKSWSHLSGLKLADPKFNSPGLIDSTGRRDI
ncbi:uncharacterized protein LOC118644862 [Monomorium pharaonis]|uniref:uncharacterized protein LOC118644862 n=1 Tax=Monomorium pharaonis TaxID=307658 RepID=UPI001746DD9C|nr:uncharacterized protein LOC118644862 [Monomorium pharaonis]